MVQDNFEIGFEDTAADVLGRGIECSVKLLASFVRDYKSDTLKPYQQIKNNKEFVCKRRTPEDGEITKDMSQVEAYNMVRALVKPWPGAFYYNESGKKVVLNEYLPFDEVRKIL